MAGGRIRKVLFVFGVSLLLLVPALSQDSARNVAANLLPDKLGEFRAVDAVRPPDSFDHSSDAQFGITSRAARIYTSKENHRFLVILSTSTSESGAYAEWTDSRRPPTGSTGDVADSNEVGTASYSYDNGKNLVISFVKGRANAFIRGDVNSGNLRQLTKLAQALAERIDKGTGELPVLVKHLPDWGNHLHHAIYAVSQETLKSTIPNQAIWDAVSFNGGAEAVTTDYDAQKLVLVEFNTASFATDNDQRVKARLQELRNQGQPTPTAYRRVGNYAVFVFNAPSVEAANQLIDQVKYQQVVQWLGENPFSYEKATREFTETTLGVFVSVVKASGLALVTCLAVGGLFGTVLFRFRRSQQRAREAYADSDAMLRLNLDELTPESDPRRLLGRGN